MASRSFAGWLRRCKSSLDKAVTIPSVAEDLDKSDVVLASGKQRVRAAASVPRELTKFVYRDPEHVCERMTLAACQRLAQPSREWAQAAREAEPRADLRELAHGLGVQSARIAGIEGAVAGTPFYLALVPGYMNYLWQEIRMTLRLAALYDRDPAALATAAEVLWLRNVYPSLEEARAGLVTVQAAGPPAKPESRRSLRVWTGSVRRLLVFGGFLSPRGPRDHHSWRSWGRDVAGVIGGAGLWVVTWFFPVTFMIAMAWGCNSHARRLFHTAAGYYSGEPTPSRTIRQRALSLRQRRGREVRNGLALGFSILAPIAFLAYATRVRDRVGFNAISALGVLVAISLVLAAVVYGRRR